MRRGRGESDVVTTSSTPLCCALTAVVVVVTAVAAPVPGASPALDLPPGFRADVVADGLPGPRALAVDPAGTLLVSLPTEGRVVALARGPHGSAATTVIEQLVLPHGLAVRGSDLYVAETERVVRFRYDPRTRAARDPVVVVGDLPPGAHHWTRSIAFGPDGKLYVAIGSSCDVCREADHRRAAIVVYGAGGAGGRVLASGLRNPVGLAFQPGTRTLWTTVNERDWRTGGAPPDYVTAVREGDAFGWPDCFAANGSFAPDPELPGTRRCDTFTTPTLELPPHSAPLGLAFYTGRVFPPAYRGNLFVALHGSRAGLPAEGYKIVRVPFRKGTAGVAEDFATGWLRDGRVIGRPVDRVTGADGALYVSDDHGGRILRIRFVP
jgi:glucose/arabinose dehydrogenase